MVPVAQDTAQSEYELAVHEDLIQRHYETAYWLDQFLSRAALYVRFRLQGGHTPDSSLMIQEARRRVLLSRYRAYDND